LEVGSLFCRVSALCLFGRKTGTHFSWKHLACDTTNPLGLKPPIMTQDQIRRQTDELLLVTFEATEGPIDFGFVLRLFHSNHDLIGAAHGFAITDVDAFL